MKKTARKKLLSPKLPTRDKPVELSTDEAHHATHVLRLRENDEVEAMDGKGQMIVAKLRRQGKLILLDYVSTCTDETTPAGTVPLTLEMAVLKGEAMEWVVEKSVELGVKKLVPVLTAHTVVQMKNKGPEQFRERWQKIADQSLKQCGRLERMEVALPVTLEELLRVPAQVVSEQRIRIVCEESKRLDSPYLMNWLQKAAHFDSWSLLVGPEGGWSNSEKDLLELTPGDSAQTLVSLGPVILRAETAALFAESLISAYLRSL